MKRMNEYEELVLVEACVADNHEGQLKEVIETVRQAHRHLLLDPTGVLEVLLLRPQHEKKMKRS